jgi:hypothetical protein
VLEATRPYDMLSGGSKRQAGRWRMPGGKPVEGRGVGDGKAILEAGGVMVDDGRNAMVDG